MKHVKRSVQDIMLDCSQMGHSKHVFMPAQGSLIVVDYATSLGQYETDLEEHECVLGIMLICSLMGNSKSVFVPA
jgi:hypothetical protein